MVGIGAADLGKGLGHPFDGRLHGAVRLARFLALGIELGHGGGLFHDAGHVVHEFSRVGQIEVSLGVGLAVGHECNSFLQVCLQCVYHT